MKVLVRALMTDMENPLQTLYSGEPSQIREEGRKLADSPVLYDLKEY